MIEAKCNFSFAARCSRVRDKLLLRLADAALAVSF
jgi:hypothetical protein